MTAAVAAILLCMGLAQRLAAPDFPPVPLRDGCAYFHWGFEPPPGNDPSDELYAALRSNHADRAASILRAHADLIEHRYHCHYYIFYPQGGCPDDDELLTPLQIAAAFDDAAMVAAVCQFRPNLEVRDSVGRTPLLVALALRHDVEIGRVLLDAGADLQAKGQYGGTVWSEQFSGDESERGPQLKVIQFLLDRGLDPRAQEFWPERMLGWYHRQQVQDCSSPVGVHALEPEALAQIAILYRYAWRWPRLLALLAMAAGVWVAGRKAWREWRQRASWQSAGVTALTRRCELTAAGRLLLANLKPALASRYAQALGEYNRMHVIFALFWVGLFGANLMLMIDALYQFDVAHQFLLAGLVIGFPASILALADNLWVRQVYWLLQALAAMLLVAGGVWLAVEPWWVIGPVELSLAGAVAAGCGLVRLWWIRRQFGGGMRLLGLNRQIRIRAKQLRVESDQTDVEAQAGWDQGGPGGHSP